MCFMPHPVNKNYFNLPRLLIDYQLDLTSMKVLNYFFNNLSKIDIHQIIFYSSEIHLQVAALATVMKSAFFISNIGNHGVCTAVH